MYGLNLIVFLHQLTRIKYRVDGDIDFHDPANPSTTSCPFLPGQVVNVLDVPAQAIPMNGVNRRELDLLESAIYTMDPRDKYLKPRPVIRREDLPPLACPTTARAATGKNQFKLFGTTYRDTPLPTPKANEANVLANSWKFWKRRPEASPSPGKSSLLAKFQRIRGTQTEVLIGSQDFRRRVETSKEASTVPRQPFCVPNYKAASTNDLSSTDGLVVQRPGFKCGPGPVTTAHSWSNASFLDVRCSAMEESRHNLRGSCNAPITLEDLRQEILAEASASCDLGPLEPPRIRNSFTKEGCAEARTISLKGVVSNSSSSPSTPQTLSVPEDNPEYVGSLASLPEKEIQDDHLSHGHGFQRKQSFTGSVSLSYRTSENFSPGLASTNNMSDVMSHHRLSQPETPSTSEHEGDCVDASTKSVSQMQRIHVRDDEAEIPDLHGMGSNSTTTLHDETYHGFCGYNLPELDQGSTPTLKRLPNKPFNSFKHDQVHSWNDGSEHRMTALETLINDLGYLGKVIS